MIGATAAVNHTRISKTSTFRVKATEARAGLDALDCAAFVRRMATGLFRAKIADFVKSAIMLCCRRHVGRSDAISAAARAERFAPLYFGCFFIALPRDWTSLLHASNLHLFL
jgi:hypothetical protein